MPYNYYKCFNFEKDLKKKMPLVIEAFVSYYGEEYREFITNKINDAILIVTSSFEVLNSRLENEADRYVERLGNVFFSELDIKDKSKAKKDYFLTTLFNRDIFNNNMYVDKILLIKLFMDLGEKDEDIVTFLSYFRPEINEDNYLEIRNKEEYIDYFRKLYDLYQKYANDYKKFLFNRIEVVDYLEAEAVSRKMAEDRAMRRLIKASIDRLPLVIKKKISQEEKDYLDGKGDLKEEFVISKLFNKGMWKDSLVASYVDNTIEKNRKKQQEFISFINKYMEIGMGDNYCDYLEIRKVKELLDYFKVCKSYYNKLYKQYLSLYYLMYSKEANRLLSQCIGYKDKTKNIEEIVFSIMEKEINNSGFLKFDVDKDGKLLTVILLDVAYSNFNDTIIFHEFNHLLEFYLNYCNNNNYEYLSGWEKINKQKERITDYLLFDEVINDIISINIAKNFHKTGNFIYSRKENSSSYYSLAFPLVEEFYNTYKDAIIRSRINHNIDIIYNEVGKENFDEFNKLIKRFFDEFGSAVICKVLTEEIKKNRKNKIKLVEDYEEIMRQKDIILERMCNYRKDNKKLVRIKK